MKIGQYVLLVVGLSLFVACGNPAQPPVVPPIVPPVVLPTVTLTTSELNPILGSFVTFTATAAPAGKIAKLELLEGTTVLKTVDNAATLGKSVLMDVAGKRSFTAQVTDTAGVIASSTVVDVNTTAPVTNATSVVQVAMGGDHTCVLLNNSDVRCWGRGFEGQLGSGIKNFVGDDEAITSVSPIKFPTGFKVRQIAAGNRHTCALSEEGKVICWGLNNDGQLGYGDITNRGDTPETTPDKLDFVGLSPVKSIVSGNRAEHTCAILVSEEVKCWGTNQFGQLGLGNKNNIGDSPNEIENLPVINLGNFRVKQISVGTLHTCAITSSPQVGRSTLHCWGRNFSGELGYGFNDSFGDDPGETPNTKAVEITSVAQIELGGSHTCVVTTSKKIHCWGNNSSGQLGYANTRNIGDNEPPDTAGFVNVGSDVKQLSLGDSQSCALLDNNSIKCWGNGRKGSLGYGNTNNIGDNELLSDVDTVQVNTDTAQGNVIRIFSGNQNNCVLFESGNIKCWGAGFSGQLGYGNTNDIGDDEFPSSVGVVPLF
jgi:alpha-tubulin suppressor-like RCC1 family protein